MVYTTEESSNKRMRHVKVEVTEGSWGTSGVVKGKHGEGTGGGTCVVKGKHGEGTGGGTYTITVKATEDEDTSVTNPNVTNTHGESNYYWSYTR